MTRLAVRKRRIGAGVREERISHHQWLFIAFSVFVASFALAIFSSMQAHSQEAAGATTAQSETTSPAKDATGTVVSIQLNKLEEVKGGCRAYFVLANKTQKPIKTLILDLILFRTDGVIGKRFFAEMAPLRAKSKKQVKLFALNGIKCSEVGSLLVNDAKECRHEDGVIDQCYSRLEVSHIGKISLSK